MSKLHRLLNDWTKDHEGLWMMLAMNPRNDMDDADTMDFAFSQCIQLNSSCAREWERILSRFPYLADRMYSKQYTHAEHMATRVEFLRTPAENLSLWMRDFKEMFPTLEKLASREARTCYMNWKI